MELGRPGEVTGVRGFAYAAETDAVQMPSGYRSPVKFSRKPVRKTRSLFLAVCNCLQWMQKYTSPPLSNCSPNYLLLVSNGFDDFCG